MLTTQKQHYGNGWEACASAVSEMETILDGLEDYSGTYDEVFALREQLKRIEQACDAGLSENGNAPLPDGDPGTVAKSLIAQIPLRRIFQDKKLADTFLSELLLAIARESGHENRRDLQKKGIEEAKAQGVRFGAPARPLPDNFEEVRKAWRDGQLTVKEAAAQCGLARTTFYNAVHRVERQNGLRERV